MLHNVAQVTIQFKFKTTISSCSRKTQSEERQKLLRQKMKIVPKSWFLCISVKSNITFSLVIETRKNIQEEKKKKKNYT